MIFQTGELEKSSADRLEGRLLRPADVTFLKLVDETQMSKPPEATMHHLSKNRCQSFYPSEPFSYVHFTMIHPVELQSYTHLLFSRCRHILFTDAVDEKYVYVLKKIKLLLKSTQYKKLAPNALRFTY